MEKSRIRDGKKSAPGSGINISDPQHCVKRTCLELCLLDLLPLLLGGPLLLVQPLLLNGQPDPLLLCSLLLLLLSINR
jgi:hypothetical protein